MRNISCTREASIVNKARTSDWGEKDFEFTDRSFLIRRDSTDTRDLRNTRVW